MSEYLTVKQKLKTHLDNFQKEVKSAKKPWESDTGPKLEVAYFREIIKALDFEEKNQEDVIRMNKPILKEILPLINEHHTKEKLFEAVYHPQAQIRNNVETLNDFIIWQKWTNKKEQPTNLTPANA